MQEYLSSKDVSEARHCLRKLAVPFFHHEVVKQALLRMMEEGVSNEESLEQLLKQLSSTGDISNSQMARVRLFLTLSMDPQLLSPPPFPPPPPRSPTH